MTNANICFYIRYFCSLLQIIDFFWFYTLIFSNAFKPISRLTRPLVVNSFQVKKKKMQLFNGIYLQIVLKISRVHIDIFWHHSSLLSRYKVLSFE